MKHCLARRWPTLIATLCFVVCCSTLSADTIWRRNGAKLVGKIVAEEEKRVQVEVQVGKGRTLVWINRSEIQRIERGLTPREEYEARLAKLQPHDLPGLEALIEWAQRKRLVSEVATLEKKKTDVVRLYRMHKHPRRWCRTCTSHGQVPCADCDGEGVLRDPCEACGESGEMRCKVCGHLDEGGVLRCRACAGAGKVERFNPAKGRKEKKRCDSCKGKGTHECPECGGKGHSRCSVCQGTKGVARDCPTCQKEPLRTCPTCTGSGLQPEPVTDAQWAREQEAKKEADGNGASGEAKEGGAPPAKKPGAEGAGTELDPERITKEANKALEKAQRTLEKAKRALDDAKRPNGRGSR
ncbi:MAG: hypothetical protein AAF581_18155 [Planctomycetota bacterium]